MKAQYEKIITPERSSFKAFTYEIEEFDSPWHYHPEFELTYILSSHGVRYVGNNFENFGADDLVLLGSNLPHCWKNTGQQPDKARAIVVHWGTDLLGDEWLKKPEFNAIRKLLNKAGQGIKFDRKVAVSLRPDFFDLIDRSPFDKLIGLLAIVDKLARAKDHTTLCAQGFNESFKNDDHERINAIYQYVRNFGDQKITLHAIAAQVHMREESFSRFFSKVMGKPFFSFLNEYRINVACKLLIESDEQIAQISYAAGFESLPFFYRQFKKYKSCSPNQYREQFSRI
jgi:AraC-like DNA-binding protein/quercetin dioxygenase-like cupin family protein